MRTIIDDTPRSHQTEPDYEENRCGWPFTTSINNAPEHGAPHVAALRVIDAGTLAKRRALSSAGATLTSAESRTGQGMNK